MTMLTNKSLCTVNIHKVLINNSAMLQIKDREYIKYSLAVFHVTLYCQKQNKPAKPKKTKSPNYTMTTI